LPSAARSCAIRKVFLFDEPLSNLDAALRVQMRHRDRQAARRKLKATMIYVTHDQVEAMTLADKIVRPQRADRAGRLAARTLSKSPANAVRGRLHRLAEDELSAGSGDRPSEWTGNCGAQGTAGYAADGCLCDPAKGR
jgi:ABC-type proline/glycine betaine transport system ATPase subunit